MTSSSGSFVDQALRLTWVRGINTIDKNLTGDLRDWLTRGVYIFDGVIDAAGFSIRIPDVEDVLRPIAFDANRMSCAAFETILSISRIEHMSRSLAWLGVKLYYSAFYAAHALLRLQGVNCIQIDNREAHRLQLVARTLGIPNFQDISSGFYTAVLEPRGNLMRFTKTGGRGGSHELMWGEYQKKIEETKSLILNSQNITDENKATLIAKFNELTVALSRDNCFKGNWLSKMRNDINYRHSYGVWYPHSALLDAEVYFGFIKGYMSSDIFGKELSATSSFDAFVKSCLFVVGLTKSTILDMSRRHPQKLSFQDVGPLVVIRHARLLPLAG